MPIFNLSKIQAPVESDQAIVEEVPKESTEEDTKVKVEGPLSNLFTDALQKILAAESVGADTVTMMKFMEEEDKDQSDLYVYCCDTDKMDTTGLIEASDNLKIALDSRRYKKVALVIEHISINNKLATLEAFARDIGAQVYFNSKKAVREVIEYKKG